MADGNGNGTGLRSILQWAAGGFGALLTGLTLLFVSTTLSRLSDLSKVDQERGEVVSALKTQGDYNTSRITALEAKAEALGLSSTDMKVALAEVKAALARSQDAWLKMQLGDEKTKPTK